MTTTCVRLGYAHASSVDQSGFARAAWRGTGLALAYASSSMRPVRLAISWYTIRGKVDDSTCGHNWQQQCTANRVHQTEGTA